MYNKKEMINYCTDKGFCSTINLTLMAQIINDSKNKVVDPQNETQQEAYRQALKNKFLEVKQGHAAWTTSGYGYIMSKI
jgi:hypothetical protein